MYDFEIAQDGEGSPYGNHDGNCQAHGGKDPGSQPKDAKGMYGRQQPQEAHEGGPAVSCAVAHLHGKHADGCRHQGRRDWGAQRGRPAE